MQHFEKKPDSVLRDEILADARRQAKRVTRKAEQEAQAMLEKAKAESEEERHAKLAAAQAKVDHHRTMAMATVPVELGRMRSARVEQQLLKLHDRVCQKLDRGARGDYDQTLANLAAEALARMEGDTFVLELSSQDLAARGRTLPAAATRRAGRPDLAVTVSAEPADITGGVIVRDPAGRQVWDNSLRARLDRMWPLLRGQIAEGLGLNELDVMDSGGQS
ncbi:MAG: V-type ATP synthase subunit E [Pirellulaceae bacterium]